MLIHEKHRGGQREPDSNDTDTTTNKPQRSEARDQDKPDPANSPFRRTSHQAEAG